MKGLLKLIADLTPMKITKWAASSSGDRQETADDREPADLFDGANVITSLRTDTNGLERHAVLLDLDVPAYLIPSSTPGNSHLYIDVRAGRDAYFRLLDALADCNVIERGYAGASKKKGATYLRLPWVKKEQEKEPIRAFEFPF